LRMEKKARLQNKQRSTKLPETPGIVPLSR
jgi:hypothetical protein